MCGRRWASSRPTRRSRWPVAAFLSAANAGAKAAEGSGRYAEALRLYEAAYLLTERTGYLLRLADMRALLGHHTIAAALYHRVASDVAARYHASYFVLRMIATKSAYAWFPSSTSVHLGAPAFRQRRAAPG